jgi:hypothetical protein
MGAEEKGMVSKTRAIRTVTWYSSRPEDDAEEFIIMEEQKKGGWDYSIKEFETQVKWQDWNFGRSERRTWRRI